MDTPQVDISPSGFASRLEAIADQLCTGELSASQQAEMKHGLFEEIGRLRQFIVVPVAPDAIKLEPEPPAPSSDGPAVAIPAPHAALTDLHSEINRLETAADRLDLVEKIAAELREQVNRLEEFGVRLNSLVPGADKPAAETTAPAASV